MMSMYELKNLFATVIGERQDSYIVEKVFENKTFQDLFMTTKEELMEIEGVGHVKAEKILSALALLKANPVLAEERYKITSPERAYEYLKDIQHIDREVFVCVGLNTKNEVIFRENVSVGSLNASVVHPREVFKNLIRKNCNSFLIAHNHPSGDTTPSREDIAVTERLSKAGQILGIELLDHLIVGNGKYVSLKEKGIF